MINLPMSHGYQQFSPNVLIDAAVIAPLFLLLAIGHTVHLLRQRASALRILLIWLFYGYLFAVAALTLFPVFWYAPDNPIHHYGFGRQQAMLTLNPTDWLHYLPTQIVGNLIMLAPLTFIGGLLFPKLRRVAPAIATAFLTALGIESLQLVMNYFYLGNRAFDTGDLLLNTAGGVLGFGAFIVLRKLYTHVTSGG